MQARVDHGLIGLRGTDLQKAIVVISSWLVFFSDMLLVKTRTAFNNPSTPVGSDIIEYDPLLMHHLFVL